MKRICTLLIASLLISSLTVPALADVIWEPGDSFYDSHRFEVKYVEYVYEAVRDTALYASPKAFAGERIPEGQTISINYLWKKNWGAGHVNLVQAGGYQEGWFELTDFRRLYTVVDFESSHQGEFAGREGTVPLERGNPVYLYSFPGSGISYPTDTAPVEGEDSLRYTAVYTDPEGLEWGGIEYPEGRLWVCLSEPRNSSLPRTVPKYAEDAPPEAPPPLLPAVIVAAVAAVTLLLILLLRKKNAPRRDGT